MIRSTRSRSLPGFVKDFAGHGRMTGAGFYLTETIIYIALSSLFFILLFQFTNQMYKNYRAVSSNLNSQSWSVVDLIARDLQKTNQILSIEKNKIIFSIDKIDICWELIKNSLYRIEGKYDKKNNKWANSIKSLVHYNISAISFKKDGQCISIELEIKTLNFKRDVFIRNREI